MAHLVRDREKLVNRVRRMKGQLNGVEKQLVSADEDCTQILQTLAACRGAMNGLMAEVLEGHIREHIVNPDARPGTAQAEATRELIEVLRAYLT